MGHSVNCASMCDTFEINEASTRVDFFTSASFQNNAQRSSQRYVIININNIICNNKRKFFSIGFSVSIKLDSK